MSNQARAQRACHGKPFLEGQRSQGNVQAHAFRRLQQQDAVLQGVLRSVGQARLESPEQFRNELLLSAESREQREVGIRGFAWFTPAHQGHTADEAEPPVVGGADGLQLRRGLDDLSHGPPPS